jgi:hypothetical protein
LFADDPKSFVLKLKGVVNVAVESNPADDDAVEDDDGINPGTVKVAAEGNDAPSIKCPFWSSMTLQTLIEPVVGGVDVGATNVSVIVHVLLSPICMLPEQSLEYATV